MRKRMISGMCALMSVLILTAAYLFIRKMNIEYENNLNHLQALEKLENISDEIQDDFNESLGYADFLAILVSKDPSMQESTIQDYANLILQQNSNISSVQLAPNAIVSFICPLEGNEAAIGHDLMNDPERKEYVEKAIEKRTSVMQGPVQAKQGGFLIFNRKAIFITQDGQDKFWGLSIIAVDFSELIGKYDELFDNAGYTYGIRSINAAGEMENVWGDSETFNKDYVMDSVILPDMNWEIAIYPNGGWNAGEKNFAVLNVFFYLVAAFLFTLIYKLVQIYQNQMEENKREFLTKTLNKKTILKIIEHGLKEKKEKHAIILIDLNDFKQINDQYGHPIGDAVLIEVARRIEKGIKEVYRVSRFGGDEYLVYIHRFGNEENVQRIIQNIKKQVSAQMIIEDNEIKASISAGYAAFPEEGDTFEELYKIADAKMYQDKSDKSNM